MPAKPVLHELNAAHDYRLVACTTNGPGGKPEGIFRCIKCGGTMKEARAVCKKVAS
jgi:hypothetical protein